ncbi:hypothetical protein L7F22_040120 [Adiantum nelumboides]|nr:hypothetical protein [Adiantum nelumboides]
MARGTRHTRHAVQSKNQPSSEQESSAAEEGEEEESAHSSYGATDMTSSDASDESYKIPSHMADPDSSSQSDSGPSGRPQVNPKIIRKQAQQMLHHSINISTKSKSQTPFTLNFYLQLPRPSMTDIFSQEQLQKLGLTALAIVELPTDVPGDMIHELLNRFPKVRGHNLTPERIGHALGMTTFPSVKPATRTYSKISKDATIQACQDLLHSDHPDYARNMELWKVHTMTSDIENCININMQCLAVGGDGIDSINQDGGLLGAALATAVKGEMLHFQPGLALEVFRLDAWYVDKEGRRSPAVYITQGLCRRCCLPELILRCMQLRVFLASSGIFSNEEEDLVEYVASSENTAHELFSTKQLQEFLVLEREFTLHVMESAENAPV